jgi:hypothetical protein
VKRERSSVLPHRNRAVPSVMAAVLAAALSWNITPGAAAQSTAESAINRESTIKAAYLYNFGRYVRWPSGTFRSDQDSFVIGVLGADTLDVDLDRIARAKKIEGRSIVIRRFTSLKKYSPCHVLFVPASVKPEQQLETIGRLQKVPVLLVGETPGFAERGGTVNFFIEENKIRLQINQQAAERAGLKISAKLLHLAVLVKQDDGRQGRAVRTERGAAEGG